MVADNIFVIVIGRRKERLDAFVKEHGSDKAETSVFDITKMDRIPDYVAELTKKHPDLDLAFLNSGVQRPADFSKPESVDLDTIQEEILTNYTSQIALTKAFLPFLMARGAKGEAAGIAYTTSTLGLVPAPHVSNYSATKAAMHSFILGMRHQIRESGVKVIEVLPPAVQTELHGPDGGHIGMPLKEFTDEVCAHCFFGRSSRMTQRLTCVLGVGKASTGQGSDSGRDGRLCVGRIRGSKTRNLPEAVRDYFEKHMSSEKPRYQAAIRF